MTVRQGLGSCGWSLRQVGRGRDICLLRDVLFWGRGGQDWLAGSVPPMPHCLLRPVFLWNLPAVFIPYLLSLPGTAVHSCPALIFLLPHPSNLQPLPSPHLPSPFYPPSPLAYPPPTLPLLHLAALPSPALPALHSHPLTSLYNDITSLSRSLSL